MTTTNEILAPAQLWIGGSWVPTSDGRSIDIISPRLETPLGTIADATAADADRAIQSAKQAFDTGDWRHASPVHRGRVLNVFGDVFAEHAASIAEVTTMEMGCPITQSHMINGSLPQMQIRYFGQLADSLEMNEHRQGILGTTLVRREPVGVVIAIVPWNGPIYLALNKVLPALLAGCSVVLKPAPEASLGLLRVAELLGQAGLPAGVLNVVTGGREVGEYLVTHPLADRVSFTGSTAAGRRIATLCGERLRRVGLELGGKSAAIILDDADLDHTIDGLRFASMANSGQICALQTRILVSHARHDEVVDALIAMLGSMQVGDPLDPATDVGPLVTSRQRDRVEGYIASGLDDGAQLALGGGRPDDQPTGWYVEPTLFAGVSNDMKIAREEIFGPVLSVIRYSDEHDAVQIANDSDYGLAGSVWTGDREHGIDLVRRLRVGSAGVNCYGSDVNVPFGGFKSSGIGREGGPEGLDEYFEFQSIALFD